MIKISDTIKITGTVKITYKKSTQVNNIICNGMADFLSSYLLNDKSFQISHIYGQWGEAVDFPEGTGPFFTPLKTDTVTSLTGANFYTTNAQVPIIGRTRSLASNNVDYFSNYQAVITGNNNKIYIGAGLVCKTPSKEILIAHTAFDGILKESSHDLFLEWSIRFGG